MGVHGYIEIYMMLVKPAVFIVLRRSCVIIAQIGYKRRYVKGGKTATVAENILERNFNPTAPNERGVSDITYVRTYEGFLYVAMVLDLFSRRIEGWSMDKFIDRHLVINALLMAICARRPTTKVLVHNDQGS